MIDSNTNENTLKLTKELSNRIKTQQSYLLRQQQHIVSLRQEHEQLKRRVEQNRNQILKDNKDHAQH